MNRYRLATLLLSCLLAGGCAREPTGMEQLRQLCARDAGLTINRTVRADGYYDASRGNGAIRILFGSDYDFIEFCEDRPRSGGILASPGCARARREPKGSARCHPRLDRILAESVIEPYASYKEDYCVALELIDKPEARYRYEVILDSWNAKNGVSLFRRSEVVITDTLIPEVMARYISYSFNKHPGQSASKSCYHIDSKYRSYRDTFFVERVLGSPEFHQRQWRMG